MLLLKKKLQLLSKKSVNELKGNRLKIFEAVFFVCLKKNM